MAKPKTVYLTDRTLSAVRPGESLSSRLNKIVDRYLQLMQDYSHPACGLRKMFSDEEWAALLSAAASMSTAGDQRTTASIFGDISQALRASGGNAFANRVDVLNECETIALLEMLEAEMLKDRAGNIAG